jgi:hypothetical protein
MCHRLYRSQDLTSPVSTPYASVKGHFKVASHLLRNRADPSSSPPHSSHSHHKSVHKYYNYIADNSRLRGRRAHLSGMLSMRCSLPYRRSLHYHMAGAIASHCWHARRRCATSWIHLLASYPSHASTPCATSFQTNGVARESDTPFCISLIVTSLQRRHASIVQKSIRVYGGFWTLKLKFRVRVSRRTGYHSPPYPCSRKHQNVGDSGNLRQKFCASKCTERTLSPRRRLSQVMVY